MRAGAGFDAADAFGGEHALAEEEFGVFAGVNVVGDDSEIGARPEAAAQAIHERRFARANRTCNANTKSSSRSALVHGPPRFAENPQSLDVLPLHGKAIT